MNKKIQNRQQPTEQPTSNPAQNTRQTSIMVSQSFAGPLPHPSILQKYEEICPGAANRIIKVFEGQVKHRQGIEGKVIGSNVLNERLGIIAAFVITITMILVGAGLLMYDKKIEGLATIFIPLAFQAYNYIQKKKEEKEVGKKDGKQKKTIQPKG